MSILEIRSVLLCKSDRDALLPIIANLGKDAESLFDEIDAATVVPDNKLPGNVVRMNSVVKFEDLDSQEQFNVNLVYPRDADGSTQNVSVTAPVGAALIGLLEGQEIEWPLPFGKVRRLRVLNVGAPL